MVQKKLSAVFIICFLTTGSVMAQKPNTNGYTTKTASADGTGKFYLGREIARVMGFEGASWLERDSRDQEENTKLAVSKIPIKATDVIADIGAGTGYYTFRIAPKVAQGRVYAVEVQQSAIEFLKLRSKELNLSNVSVVKSTATSANLPENSVDLAFMVDVYHELSYPQEMLQSIKKALKPGGKLLLIEYRAEDPSVEIKPLHKMSVAQVTKELKANGFKLVSKGDFLPIQHFLIYQKE